MNPITWMRRVARVGCGCLTIIILLACVLVGIGVARWVTIQGASDGAAQPGATFAMPIAAGVDLAADEPAGEPDSVGPLWLGLTVVLVCMGMLWALLVAMFDVLRL